LNATKIITRRHAKGQRFHNCLEENNTFTGWAPRLECLTHVYGDTIKFRFSAPAT